jgi:hypothetical protein
MVKVYVDALREDTEPTVWPDAGEEEKYMAVIYLLSTALLIIKTVIFIGLLLAQARMY